jgi:hypothetical protein
MAPPCRLYKKITGHPHQPKTKERTPGSKKKKVEPWKNNIAKAFLRKLLLDSEITLEGLDPKQIHNSHPVFEQYVRTLIYLN